MVANLLIKANYLLNKAKFKFHSKLKNNFIKLSMKNIKLKNVINFLKLKYFLIYFSIISQNFQEPFMKMEFGKLQQKIKK